MYHLSNAVEKKIMIKMIDASKLKKNTTYILTKYAILGDVAKESPKAAELLAMYGLHCVSCMANSFDTLDMGAKVHGMTDKEVDEMVEEVNTELAKESV